jgi:hypothetical protein
VQGASIISDPLVVFTNDGTGTVGVIDTRIDQVVSAPPLAVAACPKPRQLALVRDSAGGRIIAYVACGQPDNSVVIVTVPETTFLSNDVQSPAIEIGAISTSDSLQIKGKGLTEDIRVELITGDATACLTFEQAAKVKKRGKKFLLKGPLSDGRRLSEVLGQGPFTIIRITLPDGTVRLIYRSPTTS